MGGTQSQDARRTIGTEVITATASNAKTELDHSDPKPGHSPILRETFELDRTPNFTGHPMQNTWDLFEFGLKNATENSKFGQRRRNQYTNELEDFYYLTYAEMKQRALAVGSGLLHHNLPQPSSFPEEEYGPGRAMKMIGVVALNSLDFESVDLAVSAYGWTMVPFYRKMGGTQIRSILDQTRLEVLFMYSDLIDLFLELGADEPLPLTFILFDKAPQVQLDRLRARGITVLTFEELVRVGKKNIKAPTPSTIDDVNLLCFTSGTTGGPKGVIITNRNWVSVLAGCHRHLVNGSIMQAGSSACHFSYLPVAHCLEKMMIWVAITQSCRIGFFSGDVTKIVEDCGMLQPTFMPTVPRIIRRVIEKIKAGVAAKSPVQQKLFYHALEAKRTQIRKTGDYTHPLYDKVVFRNIRNLLGGKLTWAVNGGAALDQESQEIFQALFSVRVNTGYGMTETTGPSLIGSPWCKSVGNCGQPMSVLDCRLKDVPEMGYYVSATLPAGEVLLRGEPMTVGYFMKPEATAKLRDSEGWIHTGDVGRMLPDGTLQIIDRASDIFKLSNGEWVSPDRVEGVYLRSKYVAQILVHGDASRDNLVGIVIPDEEQAAAYFNSRSSVSTASTESEDTAAFTKAILEDMSREAKAADLKPAEMVRQIEISETGFSVENGMLTPTLKTKRVEARKTFQDSIERLHAQR